MGARAALVMGLHLWLKAAALMSQLQALATPATVQQATAGIRQTLFVKASDC